MIIFTFACVLFVVAAFACLICRYLYLHARAKRHGLNYTSVMDSIVSPNEARKREVPKATSLADQDFAELEQRVLAHSTRPPGKSKLQASDAGLSPTGRKPAPLRDYQLRTLRDLYGHSHTTHGLRSPGPLVPKASHRPLPWAPTVPPVAVPAAADSGPDLATVVLAAEMGVLLAESASGAQDCSQDSSPSYDSGSSDSSCDFSGGGGDTGGGGSSDGF
jgi:uncharacterized membrane protein YgcG